MPPMIPELASIGAAHVPQISATLDAQLELDGFETAAIADLPTKASTDRYGDGPEGALG